MAGLDCRAVQWLVFKDGDAGEGDATYLKFALYICQDAGHNIDYRLYVYIYIYI